MCLTKPVPIEQHLQTQISGTWPKHAQTVLQSPKRSAVQFDLPNQASSYSMASSLGLSDWRHQKKGDQQTNESCYHPLAQLPDVDRLLG